MKLIPLSDKIKKITIQQLRENAKAKVQEVLDLKNQNYYTDEVARRHIIDITNTLKHQIEMVDQGYLNV